MRIASYNVQNLFDRAKALNTADWSDHKAVLEDHAKLNELLNAESYTASIKTRIVELVGRLGLTASDTGPLVQLRQNKGRLLKRPRAGGVEVVAAGRADWIGWVELRTERVDARAAENIARVLRDVDADIVGVVEVDNRIALKRFVEGGLKPADGTSYPVQMVIDGNDERGIDVGLLAKPGYALGTLRTHVDDADTAGRIFSRDCPEYQLDLPNGDVLVVLVNHLKSKGFGTQRSSNELRRRQAVRIGEIYARLRREGVDHIAVLGDFNDTPQSAPLAPLLGRSDLCDISTHPAFDDGGRPGTFGNGTKSNKIDYILLSPALFGKVRAGGIFRKGVWGGKNGTLWPVYDTMTAPVHAASDHAALWAELDLGF